MLCGSSAGMICWFEAGVTDSFGPQLEGMRDGLGFLPGSACPHYDGEELRRPRYRGLVDDGFPAGLGGRGRRRAPLRGNELVEVGHDAAGGKRAYRVEPGSETPLEAARCSEATRRRARAASQPATLMPIQIGVSRT